MVLFSVFAMNPIPGMAGFGVPVFSDQTSYYVQVCHGGRITGFETIEISNGERHFTIPRMMFCVGDMETFAFFLDREEIVFGSRSAISISLNNVIETFHDRPFLLFDIAEFLGDGELQKIAIESIDRISGHIHDASKFNQWFESEGSENQATTHESKTPTVTTHHEKEADGRTLHDSSTQFGSALITPYVDFVNETDRKGTAVVAPLERGYGLTVGNSLRRVLMSSLQGAAITTLQVDNVMGEFSRVKGVREDIVDIILNLKGVCIRMEVEEPKRVSIVAKGPGIVTAGDISEARGLEVLNRDHVICHLEGGADLFMEMTVSTGRGYVAADSVDRESLPIGVIPIDAVFSPVRKVNYDVQPTREGLVLDYDKLNMKIETDGSISPRAALSEAAKILAHQLEPLFEDEAVGLRIEDRTTLSARSNPMLEERVEELQLSIRSANCLRNSNIILIKDLVKKNEAELLRLPNFGRKSLNEIKEVISAMGLRLGMDTSELNIQESASVKESD